jgi:hypothetical protein
MANHSPIKDTGAFFTIVPETREVTVPKTHKVIGVVGDHLAEQLTFEIPQYIDGHDIGGCARRYVSWANVDGEPGNDQLNELTERPEGAKEGMLYFTWTIRDRLAAAKGLVQFSVHFEDIDDQGVTLYHWGTTNCKNCEILDSVNHAVGTYKAIWVAGDTLVIEDYTPVEDGALVLETPGIVPEGTLTITENGLHEVGKYAQVDVNCNPKDTLDLTVTDSGEHDVKNYQKVRLTVFHECDLTVINRASRKVYVQGVARDENNAKTVYKNVGTEISAGRSKTFPMILANTEVTLYDGTPGTGNAYKLIYSKLISVTGAEILTDGYTDGSENIKLLAKRGAASVEIVDR